MNERTKAKCGKAHKKCGHICVNYVVRSKKLCDASHIIDDVRQQHTKRQTDRPAQSHTHTETRTDTRRAEDREKPRKLERKMTTINKPAIYIEAKHKDIDIKCELQIAFDPMPLYDSMCV